MQEPPQSVYVGKKGKDGVRCELVGFAVTTKDALYKGINSQGQEVHAIVTNRFAHECQAAWRNRGS